MDGLRTLSISGWTQPHDFLSGLFPDLHAFDYASHPNLDSIEQAISRDADVVIGWSLGGIIARQLIARKALQPKALVLISSPFQFVKDEDVAHAMPKDTFDLFYSNYRDDTQRTVSRFDGLMAKGDVKAKDILRGMRHHAHVMDAERWLPWMDFLEEYSAKHHDYSALPETLIIHGKQDAIVPYQQSLLLSDQLTNAEHVAWEEAGHALHLHDGDLLRKQIHDFVKRAL
ncbi:MAG: alpha/beta hydrolase [Rickettsiales bacterium]|nr:alpha/beta hydrolase [Rickettsiales bacterium]